MFSYVTALHIPVFHTLPDTTSLLVLPSRQQIIATGHQLMELNRVKSQRWGGVTLFSFCGQERKIQKNPCGWELLKQKQNTEDFYFALHSHHMLL